MQINEGSEFLLLVIVFILSYGILALAIIVVVILSHHLSCHLKLKMRNDREIVI